MVDNRFTTRDIADIRIALESKSADYAAMARMAVEDGASEAALQFAALSARYRALRESLLDRLCCLEAIKRD